jgi:DNA-binding LacI/PurR family transcriptional regulator
MHSGFLLPEARISVVAWRQISVTLPIIIIRQAGMNLREIANRAKVSIATVSRTINRVPTVRPANARRVQRVIAEVGYYPNTHARALVSGRSRIFGLMVSEITNPFFPEIVQTFEDLGVEHKYEILLSSITSNPGRVEMAAR